METATKANISNRLAAMDAEIKRLEKSLSLGVTEKLARAEVILVELRDVNEDILARAMTHERNLVPAKDAALALCQSVGLPTCKLIRELLVHYGVAHELDLTLEQREEITTLMEAFDKMIILYTQVLLRAFDATHADKLHGDDRKSFDASMRAFIEREDHYA